MIYPSIPFMLNIKSLTLRFNNIRIIETTFIIPEEIPLPDDSFSNFSRSKPGFFTY